MAATATNRKRNRPSLPDPVTREFRPLQIDAAGRWLVLADVHVPNHDRRVLETAIADARRRGVAGVLLNGDVLDSHEISDHDKDPSAPRYVEEIQIGRQLFEWLRDRLPKARIIYKEGNHEERCTRYILRRAPALFGLEGLNLPSFLELGDLGVEWIGEKRVVKLGKLNVIHGHEYPGGVVAPASPARGLYLKAKSVALCGHHHRTSEYHDANINGRPEAAWSVGCACNLHPQYRPINAWNHGYAFVELSGDGAFEVENRRVLSV